MSSFRVHTLSVKRMSGSYVNGEWTASQDSSFSIKASVQPLKASETQFLPEGRRNSKSYHLFTDTDLLPARDQAGKNADVVTIDGEEYEVMSCAKWNNAVIPHNDAIVVLVNA